MRVKMRGCGRFWRAEASLDVDGVGFFWGGRVSCPVLKPDAPEDSVHRGFLITRAPVCARACMIFFVRVLSDSVAEMTCEMCDAALIVVVRARRWKHGIAPHD